LTCIIGAEIHFNLAVLKTQLGDSKVAIASYRKALQIKPELLLFAVAIC
jgi:hypothetical protein